MDLSRGFHVIPAEVAKPERKSRTSDSLKADRGFTKDMKAGAGKFSGVTVTTWIPRLSNALNTVPSLSISLTGVPSGSPVEEGGGVADNDDTAKAVFSNTRVVVFFIQSVKILGLEITLNSY